MTQDSENVYAPEGFESFDVDGQGRRSWWVQVEMGSAVVAIDEADAAAKFQQMYLTTRRPNGDYGTFEMRVTKGPPLFRRKEGGDDD